MKIKSVVIISIQGFILIFFSRDAPIYEHAIGVEWNANSGKFTVYSSIKESIGGTVDGKQLIRRNI